MNRAVRLACAALFAGTTTCSLIFSASATMAKAASVHVPPGVVWSAVGFLELLSLAGTMRWLTASTARGRAHAIVVVSLTALVTAQAGWSFYGWWGSLAPVAVVLTVHMVSETLTDADQTKTTTAEQDNQDNPTVEMPRVDETTVPVEIEDRSEPARPQLTSVGWTVDQIVADLQGTDPAQRGLQRHIRDHYKVGPAKANKVLDALRMEVAS